MKKFINWLLKNEFKITKEYNDITNTMQFTKDNISYSIDPEYNGNKVAWFNLYKGNKHQDRKLITAASTQKELIEEFKKYLEK